MSNDDLLTTAQVLDFLQIGRTKLWGLVRTGAISAFRIGDGPNGSLRYRRADIVRLARESARGQARPSLKTKSSTGSR